jgi:hypothetical protein
MDPQGNCEFPQGLKVVPSTGLGIKISQAQTDAP